MMMDGFDYIDTAMADGSQLDDFQMEIASLMAEQGLLQSESPVDAISDVSDFDAFGEWDVDTSSLSGEKIIEDVPLYSRLNNGWQGGWSVIYVGRASYESSGTGDGTGENYTLDIQPNNIPTGGYPVPGGVVGTGIHPDSISSPTDWGTISVNGIFDLTGYTIADAGNTEVPEDNHTCDNHNPMEAARDAAAQAAADAINQLDQTIEHGAILVSQDGQVIALPIVSGDSSSVPTGALFNSIAAAGFSMADVVGYIHSHPSSTISDPDWAAGDNSINRAPSNNDIAFAGFLANVALSAGVDIGAWIDNFAMYVIGTDDVLREYDGIDGPTTPPTGISDADAENAANDAAGACPGGGS